MGRNTEEIVYTNDKLRKPRKKTSGFRRFARFAGIIFMLLSIGFGILFATAGLLDFKWVLAGLAGILLLFVLIAPPLLSYRFRTARRVTALLLALVVGTVYTVGIIYLTGTLSFIANITNIGIQTEEYDVIVRDDGEFDKISDIKGETVVSYPNGEDYKAALKSMQNDVDVDVTETYDYMGSADELLNGDIDVMFLNAGNYRQLVEARDNFDDDTRIIKVYRRVISVGDFARHVKVTKQSFNVYITGIDTYGSIDVASRSDANIIATVNPQTRVILLTSIPRDYYVPLHSYGEYDKLTHSGIYGADETVATAEDFMDIDINYYVKVDFTTLVDLIDAIDGITVNSDYEFVTSDGLYYFAEGENEMDGRSALAFARERDAFESGDFQRNIDQQKVLAAIIDKVTSSSTLLSHYTDILGAVDGSIEMNMPARDIKSLVRMQTADMSGWKIEHQSMTGDVDSAPCYSLGGQWASVVLMDDNSVAEARANIETVMDGGTIE